MTRTTVKLCADLLIVPSRLPARFLNPLALMAAEERREYEY
jgi:hypothetical protein